ncbi:MAG: hypothetical protein JNK85_01905 [Verrucomicrobiales bacterium]|nr:hypothetical protein [Verrucomicrobiales bacterium]
MKKLSFSSLHSHLQRFALGAALLAPGWVAQSQEFLPREEALRYALVAALHEPTNTQAPIRVDADLKRPVVGHDGDYGVMILPETKLSAATLEKVGRDVVPIGQLWLRKLTPMANGFAVDSSELHMVQVRHEGESARVPFCLLGARRNESGALELVVYGRGAKPIAQSSLIKSNRTQSLPIELSAERDSDSGRLSLHLVGQYTATISVTELPE